MYLLWAFLCGQSCPSLFHHKTTAPHWSWIPQVPAEQVKNKVDKFLRTHYYQYNLIPGSLVDNILHFQFNQSHCCWEFLHDFRVQWSNSVSMLHDYWIITWQNTTGWLLHLRLVMTVWMWICFKACNPQITMLTWGMQKWEIWKNVWPETLLNHRSCTLYFNI